MKIVIIGGVAGGATAAARLRRLDETAEIIMLERTGYVSYANCGLPYYVGGVIENKKALTLQTPESFHRRFRIDVRVKNEALSVDPATKTVVVRRLEDGTEYTESYDKLILAPGAKTVFPPFPGRDDPRIVTLRTVEDALFLRETLERTHPKRAVVVGGGFIGLEAAENLMHAGVETALVELGGQVLPPIDADMASLVHAYLRGEKLALHLHTGVRGFAPEADGLHVLLEGKEPLVADLVVMAVGVAPDSLLAKQAGLSLGTRESILVNEQMQTSNPDIYAVGDAVQVRHFVSGEPSVIALAGPANKQARIAADHICGRESAFGGTQGSSVIKLFDMTVASTGLNEKAAQQSGVAYDSVLTYSASHATYYPGATDMTIKTLYAPDSGKILGAQIVGFTGVDKRLDVLATAIRGGMTAADLAELELSYAPPYSSAKDPVNMAGFVIENIRAGLVKQFHWQDIPALQEDPDALLLDVRTKGEYAEGRIPGTVSIPLDSLREHLSELDKTKRIYVNCFSGLRSYLACRILSQNGFDCYNLAGGYHFYQYVAEDACFDSAPTHPCGLKIER